MRLDLHILRSHSHELAIDFGSLLLVYDSVMKYTGDFGGITLRRVCVEDDFTVLKPFYCKGVSTPLCEWRRVQAPGA